MPWKSTAPPHAYIPQSKSPRKYPHAANSKMSTTQKMTHILENAMEAAIEDAVRDTFRHGASSGHADDDTDAFVHALLVRLGLRAASAPFVPAPRAPDAAESDDELMPALEKVPESASVDSKDSRKRTVSKKMKDTFLAMEGGSEDALKSAMKVYKSADQTQLDAWGGKWDAFARAFLAGECAPAKKGKSAAAKKEKAPKVKGNFAWTPTAKKVFAEVVEGNGGTVTDALKAEFVAHVNAMDADKYAMVAPVGHVRAFIASKAPGASRPVHDAEGKVLGFTSAPAPAAEDEDEDLEEIEIEGEALTIGVKSGKIFRATEHSGDVQIGVAGQGKYAAVKIPSA